MNDATGTSFEPPATDIWEYLPKVSEKKTLYLT